MSVLDAVVALATLVKKLSDDSAHNIEACGSLAQRVGLLPRYDVMVLYGIYNPLYVIYYGEKAYLYFSILSLFILMN
jgi:hypothetical protein